MRCLNCRRDGISLTAQVCPHCGAHLPSLMRDMLAPGTLLRGGEYRIDYALGQGGFGITYRAVDLNLERPVAIKEFYPQEYVYRDSSSGRLTMPTSEADAYERWLSRFEREGRILARLNHQGIVRVFSLFKENQTAYLVMELLAGRTLKDELDAIPGQPIAEPRVVEIMEALVEALDTVHCEGVYHLDLKPDNIMLTGDGRIVLIDFGSARQDLSSLTSRRGRKSTMAYTPEYAPLELLQGEGTSAASDVFELGMILHELLTGKRPEAAWDRLLRGDTWAPNGLAAPWREMVSEALRLKAEERPQNVKAWWSAYTDFTTRVDRRVAEEVAEAGRKAEQAARERDRNEAVAQRLLEAEQPLRNRQPSPHPSSQPKPSGLSRRALILGGLGVTGLGGAVIWGLANRKSVSVAKPLSPAPFSSPATFNFETVTVDERGEIIKRENKQALYFTEELGGGVLLEMVEIPAGEFMMGSPTNEAERNSDEEPQHRVSVLRLFMGRFAVTQAQWQQIMGNNPSQFKGNDRPVEQVSWYDAQEFCKKLSQQMGMNYRLPSEAEWEYACRAGTTTPFHFGPTITPELVNYDGNYPYGSVAKGKNRGETTPVGSFPANGYGLHDMHGNVWEWCEDLWHDNYQRAPKDGSAWVTEGDDSRRLLRGGSWYTYSSPCRSASRNYYAPAIRDSYLGLRVSCSAPEF
jgi:eukaryotic-like serine/threonine-protein kinase